MKKKLIGARKSVALSAAALAMMGMAGTQNAQACGAEPYMGMLCMTAAAYCPRGYVEAKGQMMSIAQNNALFAILGTQYGGDGRTTFGVPDMRGRTPMGLGRGPGSNWDIRQGQLRGQETKTLSILEMPAHAHDAQFISSGGTGSVDVTLQASRDGGARALASDGDYLAKANAGRGATATNTYTDTTNDGTVPLSGASGVVTGINVTGTVAVGLNGGGQAFDMLPPQMGVRYCMAVDGLFPPRD